jgi:anaerobic selenocysteine-containing dehydrogenase
MTDRQIVRRRSFCRFCQASCGIVVSLDGDQVIKVEGDPEHPLSRGYTCPKGRALGAWHHHPARVDRPRIGADDVSWDACLTDLAGRVQKIVEESGPHAVGIFFGTGSSFDSAGGRGAYAFHAALGSRSRYTARTIDTPCRPLVSDLMGGHPGLIPQLDDETTTMLVLVGTNPVVSHGHLIGMTRPAMRLRQLTQADREVWVLDPRATESARLASRHLQLVPGSDYAVLGYALRELLGPDGGADLDYLANHASGLRELEAAVRPYDLSAATALTGLAATDLEDFVAAIRRHRRLVLATGTGSSMSRAANITEWFGRALQVVTGSYERPGGAWFNPGFLRGMDKRRHSPTPAELVSPPGPSSRPELSRRYDELPCSAMTDEIEAGNLRALFVVGGNLITAFPERERLRRALSRLDVLASVDVIDTETTALATHVLPAAGQLERADVPDYIDQYLPRVMSHYTPAVVAPAGDRKPVWWIFAALAERLGLNVLPRGLSLDTATDEDYVRFLAARGRLTFDELKAAPTAVVVGGPERGWVTDKVLPDGRWRLAPPDLVTQLQALAAEQAGQRSQVKSPSQPASAPLLLIPGRQLRTLNSALRDIAAPGDRRDTSEIRLSPADAERLCLADGAEAVISSRVGSADGHVRVDPSLRPGTVHIPHGWHTPGVSNLISGSDVDALTGMPLQAGVPVTVRPKESSLAG